MKKVSTSKNNFMVQSEKIMTKMKFLAALSENYSKMTPKHITASAVVNLTNWTEGI